MVLDARLAAENAGVAKPKPKPKAKHPKKKRAPKKKPSKRKPRCKTVVDRKTKRKRKICRKKKPPRKPTPAPIKLPPPPVALPDQPAPSPAAPPPTTGMPAPDPAPDPDPGPSADPGPGPDSAPDNPGDLPRQATFGRREAERLLWRAGFGPRPGDIDAFAALTVEQAVQRLTRPEGAEQLVGAPPVDSQGDPYTQQRALFEYGGDVIWWFDRMVRTTWPLAQRMTLIWHDWFATADRQMIGGPRMLGQNALFRSHWLGNFRRLAHDVTTNEAMLVWLNGLDNERSHPNENYARELMELFMLGADRGAYTERDVRELARVLTGYTATWSPSKMDLDNFRFEPARHDSGSKALWSGTAHARTGAFGWSQGSDGRWACAAVDLCLANPFHPSFFVRKLWSYFIPSAPSPETQAALERRYVDSGYEVRPVVEGILMHPDLYASRRLVKPPAVFAAGLLRARGETIHSSAWDGRLELSGQRLFDPPDVAGWRDEAWLDTNTLLGRAAVVAHLLEDHALPVGTPYPNPAETAAEAVDAALAFWGRPWLSDASRAVLVSFAERAVQGPFDRSRRQAQRINALRLLVAIAPDHHTC